MHKFERAKKVSEWRKAFHALTLEAKVPLLENVHIYVTPYHKDRRWVADVGNIYPAFKAALDGVRDAGGIEDDDPSIVKFVAFLSPIIGFGDGLELEIVGDEADITKVRQKIVPKAKKLPYNNGRKKSATRSRNGYARKRPRIP